MKKKAFTLIELIAVLVILAILALIVTPLVMNIIRKARIAADRRSIDAYGRSIELAITGYLMDNGDFPTSINDLTIEYSVDEVVCSRAQINSDSTVYLSGCTVAGKSVDGYTYGKEETITYDAYEIGDEVTYNNVDYYVIANSGTSVDNVTLLKKTPLTVNEVNQYGAGHVNMYVTNNTNVSYYQQAYNINYNSLDTGFGGMAYYSRETCGYVNNNSVDTGCTTDYEQSDIKYVVDAWKETKAPAATEARLISLDDLTDNLGIELTQSNVTSLQMVATENTPDWLAGENYWYWTMTPNADQDGDVWYVNPSSYGGIISGSVKSNYSRAVRPVITLRKSVL